MSAGDEPIAYAVYGRATGFLRYVEQEVDDETREFYDVVPLVPESPAGRELVALSRWIDEGNVGRDAEAVTWGRLAKIAEEHGEVIAAFIGWTGQNPRKGVTHTREDVEKELLDVAITALGALEHLRGHDGTALEQLQLAISRVAKRAGVVS